MFNPVGSKPTVCTFANTPDLILTGHESGKVALFDAKTGEEVDNNERAHNDVVTDLQISKDRTYFITSSKDKTARVRLRAVESRKPAELIVSSLDTRNCNPEGIQDIHDGDPAEQCRDCATAAICVFSSCSHRLMTTHQLSPTLSR